MLQIKLLSAVIALGFSSASTFAQTQNSFNRDGNTYNYSIVTDGDTIRLTGVVVETRENFDLRVYQGGYVEGAFGTRPVTFRVSQRMRDGLAAKLATAERLASGVEVRTR